MAFQKTSVEYLLSRSILRDLKSKGLLTDEEFNAIDRENSKSFKSDKMGQKAMINLIS